METFWHHICRHPRITLFIALSLLVPAVFGIIFTPLNYDIFSYMPDDVESIRGQLILQDEFGIADTAYIMVEKTNVAAIQELKEDLESLDGVRQVAWLGDIVDPSVPDAFIPADMREMFKNGDNYLLSLTFTQPGSSPATQETIEQIRERLTPQTAFIGLPVLLHEMNLMMQEMAVESILAAFGLATLVIAIALGSLTVPLIIMLSIGMAVTYNMGTNFVLGSVSYISGGVAAAIQLGVTLDFSIFLIHRWNEELLRHERDSEAMAAAAASTFRAVFPSALTTMAGFLALSFMQLKIGLDMGVVMAKGVGFGLIASLTILPSLLLVSGRHGRIRHTQRHRDAYSGIARFLVDHASLLAVLFLLLFIPALYGRARAEISYNMEDMLPQTLPAVSAMERVGDTMGSVEMAYVIIPRSTPVWQQLETIAEIKAVPGVNRVIAMPEVIDPAIPASFVPEEARRQFIGEQHATYLLRMSAAGGSATGNEAVKRIRAIMAAHDIAPVYLTGNIPITSDLTDLSAADITRVNIASMISIVILIALLFVSVSVPVVLVLGIQLAIFTNLAIPYFLGQSIPYITVTSISAIQLGATVDYAILLITRYREGRQSLPPTESMVQSLSNSAPAIITAAFGLFSATFGIAMVSEVETLRSLTAMMARGSLISMTIIILLLPAVILKCDPLITRTSRGWHVRQRAHEGDHT